MASRQSSASATTLIWSVSAQTPVPRVPVVLDGHRLDVGCVVDDDVDASPPRLRPPPKRATGLGLVQILAEDVAAVLADLGGEGLGFRLAAPVVGDDLGIGLAEEPHRARADPARGAGHEHHLALEVDVQALRSFRMRRGDYSLTPRRPTS